MYTVCLSLADSLFHSMLLRPEIRRLGVCSNCALSEEALCIFSHYVKSYEVSTIIIIPIL